jgi:hypothetical protein
VIALIIGVLIGVLAGGGGGDDKASKTSQPIKLEPISATSDNPFTPPVSPDTTSTPPPTVLPPPTGNTPFGGTGDNALCDREKLISFLTDSAHATEARAWAGVVGISVSDIATYIRDLIPTVLTRDTYVTNHTFKNGRAVPLQSVLQAGTAVLVDQYGKLVARCRCGNPLLEPQKLRDPVYVGQKWPGFDPTVIVIIVPKDTPVYPKGGVTEPTIWTVRLRAQASNIRGSRDSTTVVEWGGTFTVDGTSLSGTGNGTVTFDGGCYTDGGAGTLIQKTHNAAAYDVAIAGSASGTTPDRAYSLGFTASGWTVTEATEVPGEPGCSQTSDPSGFVDATTELFGSADVPAKNGSTQITLGEYSVDVTLEAAGSD